MMNETTTAAMSRHGLLGAMGELALDALTMVLRPFHGRATDSERSSGPEVVTIELRAQLSHEEAPTEAIEQLLSSLGSFSNVMTEPPPNVAVSHYNLMGTVLMVRVHCKREHYWQVFMAVTDEIGSRSVSHSHRRIRMKL